MTDSIIAILTAILPLAGLALAFGALLGFAAIKFKMEGNPVVDSINNLLPQTQCGQCGHPGCKPYAEAIAAGEADINQCPPGGEDTIQALADLLGVEAKPLDAEEKPPAVAFIREEECIGCTLCIKACPVDAILGAPKLMHTVIADECTGCELCLEPCPVDCIDMPSIETTLQNWTWPMPEQREIIPLVAAGSVVDQTRTETNGGQH
jgi:electron transport complex protein RnfB